MGILSSSVAALLPLFPVPIMRRLSARYIAGEELADALERLRALRADGYPGILNVLGEDVSSEDEARGVVAQFNAAADAVNAEGLDAYISVKPTHLGLRLDEALTTRLYAEICRHCAQLGLLVRVEMEDHTTVDATLRVFESLRAEFDNVGVVLQSRLFRTPDDIAGLAPGPLDVRMVKGIYLEPAAVAHTEPDPIRQAFVECTRQLWARGARVAIASHDAPLGDELLKSAPAGTATEFEVLLGVQEWLWKRWADAGHVVRVYVPYGPEWRPYSLRRMKKNPQIVAHVMRQTFGLGPRRPTSPARAAEPASR